MSITGYNIKIRAECNICFESVNNKISTGL